jgi:hypothetical protein
VTQITDKKVGARKNGHSGDRGDSCVKNAKLNAPSKRAASEQLLAFGFWLLALGFGLWALGFWLWVFGFGFRPWVSALGFGLGFRPWVSASVSQFNNSASAFLSLLSRSRHSAQIPADRATMES